MKRQLATLSFCIFLLTLKVFAQNEVKMKKHEGGTYELPVIVNDVLKINFVFDPGASDISISPDVALTLYKAGTIKDNDWLEGKEYMFADGSTAKSYRFTINKLKIGGHYIYGIPASISNSVNAPLLLGQSALNKLGKIEIDYGKDILKISSDKAASSETDDFTSSEKTYVEYHEPTKAELGSLYTALRDSSAAAEDYYGAIRYCGKLFNLDSSYWGTYHRRGEYQLELGDIKGAIADYTKSIAVYYSHSIDRKDNEVCFAYYSRALAYDKLKNYSKAIQDYTKVITLNKGDNIYHKAPESYYNRGIDYLNLSKIDEACSDWRKAGEMGELGSYDLIKQHCQ